MKTYTAVKHVFFILASMLLTATLAGTVGAVNAAELTITVSGIMQAKGNLYIRVYASDSQWLSQDEDGPLATEVIDLEALDFSANNTGEITRAFQLPEGTYAATAIHDSNKNGKLDSDWRGVPKEPTGTTGAGKKEGPPKFSESEFELSSQGSAKTIRLSQYQ
jgi:uncharacterized protein (DUF2141 family)